MKEAWVSGSAVSEEEKSNIVIKEKNIKYAMIAYTTLTNGLRSPNNYYVIYSDEIAKRNRKR